MAADRTVKVSFIGDAGSLTRAAAASEAAFSKVGGAASKAASSVTSSVSKIGSSAATIGKGIAIGAAGLAIGGAAIGTALFKVGESFDAAYDKIRIGTGATGAQLKGFEDSVKKVFSSVPTDLSKASDAFVALQQRTQGAGVPLETVTKQMLELSRITKTDLAGNIGATQDAFQAFGITLAQQPKFLDELFIASQKTGVAVADIASSVADAQPQLSSLGFSFEQSAALAGVLGKAGSSLSDVMPALSKAMAVAAKQGKDAGTVFSDTFTAIKNAPNATKAAGIALDVFGAKAGPKLATLIREGKLSYQDLLKTMQSGGDTIIGAGKDTQDFGEKLQLFKNRLAVAFEPIAIKLFDAIGAAMDKVGPPFAKGVDAIIRGLKEIRSGFAEGVNSTGFIGVLQRIGDLAHTVFTEARGSVYAFVNAFKKGGDEVTSSGVPGFFERLGLIARDVFEWLKDNGPAIFAALKSAGETALKFLGDAFEKIADVVKNTIYPAIKSVVEFMLRHKETLVGVAVAVGVAFAAWAISAASAAIATAAAAAPFILLAAAIGAAVAGLIYAYKHFERFRNIVDATGRFLRDKLLPAAITAGKGIASAFQTGVAFFKDTFLPAVISVARWLGEQLGPAFKAVAGFVTGSLIPALKDVVGWFNRHRAVAVALATVLATTFLGPIAAIAAFVGAIVYAYKHSEKVRAVLDTVGRVLRDKVAPALKVAIEWYIKFVTAAIKVEIALAKAYIAVARFAVKVATAVAPAIAAVIGWFIKFNVWITKVEIGVVKAGISVVKFAVGVVKAFIDVAKGVGEKVGQIVGFILGIGSKIAGFAVGLFDGIKDAISTAKDWVGDRIGDIVGFFVGLGGRIASGAGDVFGFVMGAITTAKDWVGDRVNEIVGFVEGIAGRIAATAKDMFFDIKFAIVVAKNFVSDKVDDILRFFKNLPGDIAGFMSGLADTISSPFKAAFNEIARLWNNTVGKLSFSVPDWIPGLGGHGWDVPDIPTFDVGGVVKGSKGAPVLALVHAGETVLPTHKMSFGKAATAALGKGSSGPVPGNVLRDIEKKLFGSIRLASFDNGGVVGGFTTATPEPLPGTHNVFGPFTDAIDRNIDALNRLTAALGASRGSVGGSGGGGRSSAAVIAKAVKPVLGTAIADYVHQSKFVNDTRLVTATSSVSRVASSKQQQPITVVVELDGKTLATSTAKYANSVGGINMRIRARS